MDLAIIWQAAATFVGTNIDDLLVLSLFFGQTAGRRAAEWRVVGGQYLGFGIILVASIVGALAAGLLPESFLPYLGLVPLVLGIRMAITSWWHRKDLEKNESQKVASDERDGGPTIWAVAGVTLATGGDNIGLYIPIFERAGVSGMFVYCLVFLVMLALLIALGRFLTRWEAVAQAIDRWGRIVFPLVLIGLGLYILIDGGAFGIPTP